MSPRPLVAALATLAALAAAGPGRADDTLPWPPPGGEVVDGIVAIVNDEPITLWQLERAVAPFVARLEATGADVDDEQRLRIRAELLESLVNDVLILAQAREMKLEVDQKQVDAQIERLKESNAWDDEELADALRVNGFESIGAYRRHLGEELLKNQVLSIKVASRVQVDMDEVERVFREEAKAGEVEQRRATHILVKLDEFATPQQEEQARERLAAARAAAVSGEATFEELARRYSEDTNAQAGGDLGWFSKGDLDPTFEKAVFSLGLNEVSEPLRTDFGLHLIKVTGVRTKQLATDEEREALRRQIRFRLRETELERIYEQWMASLRQQAFIEIRRQLAGVE